MLSNLPEEALKINYTVDAMGKMLSGDKGREVSDEYYNSYGYVLTLNKNIQNITYNACKNMKSGCAVVMDVKTASILALVTKPDNSYINKPFQLYSAGSIFKIVVALCALENNIDISYKCSGRIRVGDTVFSCQNEHVHLKQNLKEALANSCNCYFVNLALNLGKVKLTDTARELGLNDNTDLFDNIIINNAKLPDSEDLSSKGELALLGFGQGKLQITPLHFCNIMCTVANNGNQNNTRLIKYAIDKENTVSEIYYSNNRARIKPVCCNKLCDYLRYTVSDGTAKNADFNNQCAGKTATAQTGQYKSGCEMYNTWFAGFYPYNEPEYAIVIMFENGISGSIDCCPVFRTIVENLERL
ncbi:MAG: hypothetical protein IJT65_05525 [Eubacterium sp.]|nr:hypothetical protein [Eubacterium sp.]